MLPRGPSPHCQHVATWKRVASQRFEERSCTLQHVAHLTETTRLTLPCAHVPQIVKTGMPRTKRSEAQLKLTECPPFRDVRRSRFPPAHDVRLISARSRPPPAHGLRPLTASASARSRPLSTHGLRPLTRHGLRSRSPALRFAHGLRLLTISAPSPPLPSARSARSPPPLTHRLRPLTASACSRPLTAHDLRPLTASPPAHGLRLLTERGL